MEQLFNVTHFFAEWGFCRIVLSVWRDFFSYSPVFGMDIGYLSFSNPKNIFIEDSSGNKYSRLANQSQIISYSCTIFDWSVNQTHLSCVCGKSIASTFQILICHPSNFNIGAWLSKGPSQHLLGECLYSQWQKQKSKIWLIYPKIRRSNSNRWATVNSGCHEFEKMNQSTDKSLKVRLVLITHWHLKSTFEVLLKFIRLFYIFIKGKVYFIKEIASWSLSHYYIHFWANTLGKGIKWT